MSILPARGARSHLSAAALPGLESLSELEDCAKMIGNHNILATRINRTSRR
jgi:hypothetical protein